MRLSFHALFLLTCASALCAPSTDRFWQIAFPDQSVQYWRTHTAGDSIEIRDACDAEKGSLATAKATDKNGWALSGQFGNLAAHLDPSGKLILTLAGKVYGSGQRIAPVSCKNGTPTQIRMIDVAQGERSFAVITGDATHLEQAVGVALPTIRTPPPPTPPDAAPSHAVLSSGDTYDCQSTPITLAAVRQLQNVPVLGAEKEIWPGALLQGKAFASGQFKPITIRRGSGTIWLNGVNLDPDESSSAKLKTTDAESVKKAISDLVAQKSKSIESSFDFSTDVLYNNDQMAYGLGTDGRFLNGFDQSIKMVPDPTQNYVLARFRQAYYTASIEAPPSRYSVFADKMDLKDPNNEMGQDNPPLLIDSVAYGKTIFLLVTSPFNGNDVAAALMSANDGKADTTVASGKTYSQILQGSTFSAFVQGGSADDTKKAIDKINAAASKYEAVKQLIKDTKTALVSDWSLGVPVKYTVSYLTNRATAAMGFASAYNRRDCVVTPKKYASFALNIFGIDDNVEVSMKGPSGKEVQVYHGGSTPQYFLLDNFIPDNERDSDFILRLHLWNVAGPSGLDFQLTRRQFVPTISYSALNGDKLQMEPLPMMATREMTIPPPRPSPSVHTGGSWSVGWVADFQIRLNRGTGEVTVIQH